MIGREPGFSELTPEQAADLTAVDWLQPGKTAISRRRGSWKDDPGEASPAKVVKVTRTRVTTEQGSGDRVFRQQWYVPKYGPTGLVLHGSSGGYYDQRRLIRPDDPELVRYRERAKRRDAHRAIKDAVAKLPPEPTAEQARELARKLNDYATEVETWKELS